MTKAWLYVCAALALAPVSCVRSDSLARGTLVIGFEGSPTTLDPRLATDAYSLRIDSLLFNGLTRINENGEPVPDLADRWEMPDDRTYVFHLRPGVRFHNGRELTSADVADTFASLRDPAFGSPLLGTFEIVDAVDSVDPLTVRVRLKRPHAPFLSQVTVGIVPRGTPSGSGSVGTGPFSLLKFSPGNIVILIPHPAYFRGAPSIRRIIIKIVPNDMTRVLELRKGSIHLLQNNIPPDSLADLRRDPSLSVLTRPGGSYAYLGMNLEDPVLKNIAVRKAIASSIDRRAILSHVLEGLAETASGILPPGHWAYEGDVDTYPYDPEAARAFLRGAGLPGGAVPRLSYKTSVSPISRRIGEVLVSQLDAVGIPCELRSFEWGTFFSDIKSGNFQLFTLQWVGVTDPDHFYYAFHSSSVPPRGANRVRYANPEVDALLEKGRVTLDREARKKIYSRVQKILARDLPYVSLWHLHDVVALRRGLSGFVLYPGGELYSLENARITGP